MIFAIQISLLVLLAFVPTWAGGQAMKCYDQGHIYRSVACVVLSTGISVLYVAIAVLVVKYNLGINTILGAM
jgi:hypothetical protein